MRVLRIYHAGRDPSHRERERALVRLGVDLSLVVPTMWPGADDVHPESFEVREVDVRRPGDVNRHRLVDPRRITDLVEHLRPDVVDLHEEPFANVTHQLLGCLPRTQPVVGYTAQNLDKRFPPPFAQWERRALARLDGLYPCSRQAASVAVGKGFGGAVRVLPLGVDPLITPGDQTLPATPLRLLLIGRLVPEKGVADAVEVLAGLRAAGLSAHLTIVGTGPASTVALDRADSLGVREAVDLHGWADAEMLAGHYRRAHVVLAPSRSTRTWVEQFGRMVTEAQAAGAVVAGYASGSLPEVVGGAGRLVPEGDVHGLTAAVVALGHDPDRWLELREVGLRLATTRTWDAVAAGQLDLYRAALEGGRGVRRVVAHRAVARGTWGPPAHVPGATRPFALPVLRDDTAVSRGLGRIIDRLDREGSDARPDLHVVHLDHTAQLSGGEIALERLVAARSCARSTVVLAEDGPLRPRLEVAGAEVIVLPLSGAARRVARREVLGRGGLAALHSTSTYTLRLSRLLRQLSPDVVHTNSLKAGYYGTVAARLAGVPVVWHVRDRIADDYLPTGVVWFTRQLLRRLPDVVVANSRATADTTGVRPRVVTDAYRPRQQPGALRDSASYEIAVVGRISPWKGQDVVLRALARAPGITARFVGEALFGEDDYAASLQHLTTELGLADRVAWVGFTDDVEVHLAAVDAVVHASTTPEPFGQVIVEGMAAGRPVIATAAGGPAEIITHGVDGLLTTPGDPADLADALERLRDPVERSRLGAAGLRRALDFTPERVGHQMTEAWHDAVAVGRPRRVAPSQPPPAKSTPYVVFLGHTALPSGAEIALERLIAARPAGSSHVILAEDGPMRPRLEAAGASVEVLALANHAREVSRHDAAGAGGARSVWTTSVYALRLSRRLRALRPDVVHANSLKAGYYGTVAARLAGVPVVWHVRDRIAEDYLPSRAVWLTRQLLRRLPDVVVANSAATARTTGVITRVVHSPYRPRLGPAPLGTAESYEIGVVGRISPWKGQDVVLRALTLTPGVTARFIGGPLFGEDDHAAGLLRLSDELGLQDRVTWVGFVEDVEAQLAEVDVVVHASISPEPFGQVIVEGMAAGRPVIASAAGGPADIITHDVDGLLTAPDDPADLARALEQLRSPAERSRLAAASLRRSQDYSPDRIVVEMTDAWRAAIRHRARRTRRGWRSR